MQAGGGAESEGDKQIPCESEARFGAPSSDPEIMTCTEIKSHMLNGLYHPSTPQGYV